MLEIGVQESVQAINPSSSTENICNCNLLARNTNEHSM